MGAKVNPADLARWKAKVLSRLPVAGKAKLKAANRKNAEVFAARVGPIIPREDGTDSRRAPGLLASTLAVADVGELGASVSLGSSAAPFPFHLEGGHRNKDGTHTPPKKFWNPVKRLTRKAARARSARALNQAAKLVAGGGS